MNTLKQYKDDQHLTNQELADRLTEALGRKISVKGVAQQLGREEASIPWLNALGISPKEPGNLKNSPTDAKPAGISSPLPFEIRTATQTIEMIYTMAGKGAGMASKTPEVGTLWESSAPGLAEAWINWAKENRTVANGIAMLTIGGPGGQVILMNASLIISTLIAIQTSKGIQMIPPSFIPPHENPNMTDEQIRENTEAAVDHGIRSTET